MARDTEHYDYDSYTTGRKQDYGHHELNSENGWVCYDWDRDDYTETMQVKRPKEGKGWKPFRVYWYPSIFEDFMTLEEAQKYFESRMDTGNLTLLEVDSKTGEEVKKIRHYPEAAPPPPKLEAAPLNEDELRSFIAAIKQMLSNEKEHLQFLEESRAINSSFYDVDIMIERSKSMVSHFDTRLKEYKEYAVKHYGK